MTNDEPTKSANGMFLYEDLYCYISLDEWAKMCHRNLSKKMGWAYYSLKKGAYGYDNFIVSIGHMFEQYNKYNDENIDNFKARPANVNMMAKWIHEGWVINYLYWCNNKPWLEDHGGNYRAPAKLVDFEKRDAFAKSKFFDKENVEKEKELIIARFIFRKMEYL
jgi:hypothetical protein